MTILGIDPGTARMGYGAVNYFPRKKKYDLILSNCLETPKEMLPHFRLQMLYEGLNKVLDLVKPDIIVIEKIFFNTNVRTALAVGQARGISLLVAANKKVEVFEYTALEAKMAVTGYGRSDKKQMQEAVRVFFDLPSVIKPDDANDAVAMALCYVRKTYEIQDKSK